LLVGQILKHLVVLGRVRQHERGGPGRGNGEQAGKECFRRCRMGRA
jgi:hypothetical protein